MQGQITEPVKRFGSIAAARRITGMSYQTIKHGLDTGTIQGVQTETGLWKVNLDQFNGGADTSAIVQRLDEAERMLKALCGFFKLEVR